MTNTESQTQKNRTKTNVERHNKETRQNCMQDKRKVLTRTYVMAATEGPIIDIYIKPIVDI
jgi:hypothetical protein